MSDQQIEVKINKEEGTLHIIDQGLSMTEDEVQEVYQRHIAFSGAEEFLENIKTLLRIAG
jgi:molecular chaperone HtpG